MKLLNVFSSSSCFEFISRKFVQILKYFAQSCNCMIAAFRNSVVTLRGPPPEIWNVLDWRALVEWRTPNIGKPEKLIQIIVYPGDFTLSGLFLVSTLCWITPLKHSVIIHEFSMLTVNIYSRSEMIYNRIAFDAFERSTPSVPDFWIFMRKRDACDISKASFFPAIFFTKLWSGPFIHWALTGGLPA